MTVGPAQSDALPAISWPKSYRLRLKRRRLLWRALRARHGLDPIQNRTGAIRPGAVLAFTVLRNEALRLPYFLEYYRALGVDHFLMVDNGSNDGSDALLATQPDVSLWRTDASYRASRFGMDWLGWLLMRYGHDHWCLTVDTDELLIYSGSPVHGLRDLTGWLDAHGRTGFGALMLEPYPQGPLGSHSSQPGQDPAEVLCWFDGGPYRSKRQAPRGNLWTQGGVRERVFFADNPRQSPTLNKIPLIRWNRRWVYTNSTHALLPRHLNLIYDGPGGETPSGVLLHTKFLPDIVSRSATEKQRRQHFHTPDAFGGYYDQLEAGPDLWSATSLRYGGGRQLQELGLMSRIDWSAKGTT